MKALHFVVDESHPPAPQYLKRANEMRKSYDIIPAPKIPIYFRPRDGDRDGLIRLAFFLQLNSKYHTWLGSCVLNWHKNPAYVKIQHVTYSSRNAMKNHFRFHVISFDEPVLSCENYLFKGGKTSYSHLTHFKDKLTNENIADSIVLSVHVDPLKNFRPSPLPQHLTNTFKAHEFEYYPKEQKSMKRAQYLKDIIRKDGKFLDANKSNLNGIFNNNNNINNGNGNDKSINHNRLCKDNYNYNDNDKYLNEKSVYLKNVYCFPMQLRICDEDFNKHLTQCVYGTIIDDVIGKYLEMKNISKEYQLYSMTISFMKEIKPAKFGICFVNLFELVGDELNQKYFDNDKNGKKFYGSIVGCSNCCISSPDNLFFQRLGSCAHEKVVCHSAFVARLLPTNVTKNASKL